MDEACNTHERNERERERDFTRKIRRKDIT
jgi:hypothetical protein